MFFRQEPKSDAVVNPLNIPKTEDISQLDFHDLASNLYVTVKDLTRELAISSGNYCATMKDMDVKFVSFDIPEEEMFALQNSISNEGVLFNYLPANEQMEKCEVRKDPPRTSIGCNIPNDFKGTPRYEQGEEGTVHSLATMIPAAHIHPHGEGCRKHFGTYSLIPFRLKLDRGLSEEQTKLIVDSCLLGIRPKSNIDDENQNHPRTQNSGFLHSYLNLICVENQCFMMDEYASLSFIPCFESELEYWNYSGAPMKVIVMGASPAVLRKISATDSSEFETLAHDDPIVKNAFLTAEKVVAQIANIMLSKPDEKDLPNDKLCGDLRAWLRKGKEVPVLSPSSTNTKPFMVVQLGSALLTTPGKQYPPYNSVVEAGRHHGVDPISLLCRSMNGWTNTKFFAGQLGGFKVGSEHVTCLNPKACHYNPTCSDEEGDAECDHVWARRMLADETFADDLSSEMRSELYRVSRGDVSGYCIRNAIRRIELVRSTYQQKIFVILS